MEEKSVDLKTALGLRSEAEVAELLGISVKRLRNQRYSGIGPAAMKHGNTVWYEIRELRKFIKASTVAAKKPATLIDGKRGMRSKNSSAHAE